MVIEDENGFVLNTTSTHDDDFIETSDFSTDYDDNELIETRYLSTDYDDNELIDSSDISTDYDEEELIDSSDISTDYDEEERIINHVNCHLELITRDQDGNYVDLPLDLHYSFVKHRRFNADLFPGSNLEIIKWSGQEVHRHEGGDYPIRLEVGDDWFLLYYLYKCVSLTKVGILWHLTTMNYPSFLKFFSFPDRNTAEEYLRSPNNETLIRNGIIQSLPTYGIEDEPYEFIAGGANFTKTQTHNTRCIRPLFLNLPGEEISRQQGLLQPYETSILDYDIEYGLYGIFRFKFLRTSKVSAVKIYDHMFCLNDEDGKVKKVEIDPFSEILTIQAQSCKYETIYTDMDPDTRGTRSPRHVKPNYNKMKYLHSRRPFHKNAIEIVDELRRINRRR